jgi:transcription elongation factor GreA
MERVLAHPDRNPDLFAWAGRKVIDGKLPHVAESFHPITICQSAATLLSDAEEAARAAGGDTRKAGAAGVNVAARMRTILQDGHGKLLKISLRKADLEQARRFLAHIKMLSGLSNQLRTMMEELVLLEHPTLRKRTQEDKQEAETPKVHYALGDSIERKRQELSHILNVEIPENSVAIGVAREHGDLRENAEYHAAKDRQKILMQRAADLEDLIARARVIELENVKDDIVRFGTRVHLLRVEDNAEESVVIMGMWEANADRGIISYQTPFGSQLMGRQAGEEFEMVLPDGRRVHYRVLGIERAPAPAGQP